MIAKETIKELREIGMTYQSIGDMLGLSRQRVHQIVSMHTEDSIQVEKRLKRQEEYYQRNKGKINKKHKTYRRDYLRKHYLVINGKVTRVNKRTRPDDICELCGKKVKRLVYHHWDDNKPEHGMWLCGSCHFFVHNLEKGLHTKYFELKSYIFYDK